MNNNMKAKIAVGCCLCSNTLKTEIELPENWGMRYDSIDVENGFCPDHIKVRDFAEAQCPGCVGGWGDCSLWEDIDYSGSKKITAEELLLIRKGECPRRTNGTRMFDCRTKEFSKIDLSKKADSESGIEFEKAIKNC